MGYFCLLAIPYTWMEAVLTSVVSVYKLGMASVTNEGKHTYLTQWYCPCFVPQSDVKCVLWKDVDCVTYVAARSVNKKLYLYFYIKVIFLKLVV